MVISSRTIGKVEALDCYVFCSKVIIIDLDKSRLISIFGQHPSHAAINIEFLLGSSEALFGACCLIRDEVRGLVPNILSGSQPFRNPTECRMRVVQLNNKG